MKTQTQPFTNSQIDIGFKQKLPESHQESTNFTYLKPSEREDALWGKGRFKLRFDELENTMVTNGFCSAMCSFLSFWCKNKQPVKNQPKTQSDFEELEIKLPILTPDFQLIKDKIKYTWIGHSTAVISFGKDGNFLIDPVFSERCSPVSFAGPKRYRKPACTIAQLPQIDAVLVSHDHYDHLNADNLEELQELFKPNFVAGLDSEDVFPKNSRFHPMDWMDVIELTIKGKIFKITFLPVCHWSRRGLTGYNTRLWGGFIVQSPRGHKVFYSGDTGYCPVFKQIGEKYGPFDLCILPIGAYKPRQLLAPQHIDPSQAVTVHKELRSKQSVGVHWGTFPLGFEHFAAAKDDLQIAKVEQKLSNEEFQAIKHGGSLVVNY